MSNQESRSSNTQTENSTAFPGYRALSHEILRFANQGLLKRDFLPGVSSRILEFSRCDELELWVQEEGQKHYRCRMKRSGLMSPSFKLVPHPLSESGGGSEHSDRIDIETLCVRVFQGRFESGSPFFTEYGTFWTGDTRKPISLGSPDAPDGGILHVRELHRSIALIPLIIDHQSIGILQLKSLEADFFKKRDIEFYEDFSQTLGLALLHQYTQIELRERIKEMTCLYGIAQQIALPGATFDEIIQGIVELLPPAWLHPEIASARIKVSGVSFITPGFKESPYMLCADIVTKGKHLGTVEVAYYEERPFLGEGPFLPEERNLINNVANEVALFHERRAAEAERALLQDQLRHADRLATIGQLAAGVAHELNEPLGNILGFAQLAQKTPGVMEQTSKDLNKIITASLHAREIIKKLMTFARQLPPRKTAADLNRIVDEGLYFFEARCAKSGIDLQRKFSPELPEFTADPGQLNQVLVNLLVNAVQAMPEGGTLTVETRTENGKILLIVEDTGVGMDESVKKQIFIPFFTTKDVNEGTGLGLPVVHGIVTSHKGTIRVKSKKGKGSRFEIRFPLTRPRKNKEQ